MPRGPFGFLVALLSISIVDLAWFRHEEQTEVRDETASFKKEISQMML
jgi:hypothetical protein